jgi:uncharacterized membrane protein YgdD (TMEM256/DUF423 family)
MRIFVMLGSFNMFLAVALGAFGAHGLTSRVSADLLTVWQTAVLYHLAHALGLLLVGLLAPHLPVKAAGWTLFAGIVLFSGSLYLLVLTGIRPLGMITPLGGVAFLAGWLLLVLSALKLPA